MDEHFYPKMNEKLANAAWLVYRTSFGYKTPIRYPCYAVREELIGVADSLYEGRTIIDSAIIEDDFSACYPDSHATHHFTIKAIQKCTLQSPIYPLLEYLYDRMGKPLDCVPHEPSAGTQGRLPSEIRFKVGDVCEVIQDEMIHIGIVVDVPPDKETFECKRKELSSIIHLETMADYYDVLIKDGDEYFEHCYTAADIFSPRMKVHPSTRARLSKAFDEYRSRPVRLAIEDRYCFELLFGMFSRLGLEQDFQVQDRWCPGKVTALFTHDPFSEEKDGPTASLGMDVKTLMSHPERIERGIRRALGEKVGRGGRQLKLLYDFTCDEETNIRRVYKI